MFIGTRPLSRTPITIEAMTVSSVQPRRHGDPPQPADQVVRAAASSLPMVSRKSAIEIGLAMQAA
jgi:hypothetical protein